MMMMVMIMRTMVLASWCLLSLGLATAYRPQSVVRNPSSLSSSAAGFSTEPCPDEARRWYLPYPPDYNYLYSDCHTSTHVVVTTPSPNTTDASPVQARLVVAWPAGNSGILALFAPEPSTSADAALAIHLENTSSSTGQELTPITTPTRIGISGLLTFSRAARLTVPILGSVRAIREFTETGTVNEDFQHSFGFGLTADGGASINRTWFDNVTTTWLDFAPVSGGASPVVLNREAAWTLTFGPGTYRFDATFDYAEQLEGLGPQEVLNDASAGLIEEKEDETTSLAFLSYRDKLVAGTWRFLTYFGRDSMLSLLLMQDVLSEEAIEAVIGSVLERVNHTDGTVCHEEVLGDYATYHNAKNNVSSSAPGCDYKMIDTDFLLPITMERYFVATEPGANRSSAFFARTATFLAENSGLTYAALAQRTAEKIMRTAAPFAKEQLPQHFVRLKATEAVGQWRDSNDGLGGGRVPYDVNTALVPASLRAIAALSRAGYFPEHPEWSETADGYAQVWEDESLRFFYVTVTRADAVAMVDRYAANLSVPSHSAVLTADVTYYGLALNNIDTAGVSVVPIMHTDDCFRHFLLNTTNQTQLSAFLRQTADHILQPFPVGLSSEVGLFVANAAYAGDEGLQARFGKHAYHGTVVWSWQLADRKSVV